MKFSRQRHARAFTLVEIMMAMAIFGLVLAAIYATWTLILKSKTIGEAATAQIQRERIAVRVIEEALMSTRSFAADLEHYGFVAENGENAMLSFVARLPKSFPRSGRFGDFDVRRVTFAVESGRSFGERELVLRQQPILMDLDEDEKDHPLVLAKGVKEMQFEFWDTRSSDWVEDWTQTNQLPKLVKVSLRFGTSTSLQTQDEVTRMIALPSISVPAVWQVPTPQGRLPGAGPPPPVPAPSGGAPPPQLPIR
jgi:type II secretion system protein J